MFASHLFDSDTDHTKQTRRYKRSGKVEKRKHTGSLFTDMPEIFFKNVLEPCSGNFTKEACSHVSLTA